VVEPAPPGQRVSWWWLVAPGLLFGLNFIGALLISTSAPDKNLVYQLGPILVTAATDILLIVYAVFAVWRSNMSIPATLAMRRVPLGRAIGLGALALVALVVLDKLVDPITHASKKQGIAPTHTPSDTSQWVALGVAMVALVVIAPLAEEIMFRGLAWNIIGAYALPLTAMFWAIAHSLPALLLPVFLAGLIIGELRRRTDSLWPGLGVHMTTNAIALVVALLTT
jgi:membrane protease YdiL (CAAX protease family)